MLTGELPIGRFPAPSEKNAVDPRLDKVVSKTLAKEPAKRPQSAGELGTEVQTISSQRGRAGVKSHWPRFAPSRDRAARAAAFALVFVAAVILLARLFRPPAALL
jgi:hypothetical protein